MHHPAHQNSAIPLFAILTWLLAAPVSAQDEESVDAVIEDEVAEAADEFECPEVDDDEEVEDEDRRCLEIERVEIDDTADIDTESTIDTEHLERGIVFSGDFRPLVNHVDRVNRSDEELQETEARARIRLKASVRLSRLFGFGARIAGKCSSNECDPEWVNDRSTPQQNGLDDGQFTFDEAYFHLFQTNAFDLVLGRQQTRMVMRGGVFSRSLDRNNSNNVNVTWTDGAHFILRQRQGWEGHVIVDHNAAEGSGSVRRGQLDFTPDSARTSYFVGSENRVPLGPIVQRSISITYLPNALLVDGEIDGRRESYIGYVGRMAFRWPLETSGPFFRGGFEVGYAPNVPTPEGANLSTSVDRTAWNVAASIMSFRPNQNIGIFYSHTGAGWLISPNFVHNEKGFEIRYQWRPRNRPSIDFRVRWREDLEQLTTAVRKRERVDAFLRLTWQFDL